MKNKKGFTLIEIMAVIIILVIIALIVVPLVTGSIKNSKNKLYDTQIENIKSAAKSYMINLDLDDSQSKITVTIEELKKLGLVDKDIKDPRTGDDFNKCLTVEVLKNGNIYDYNINENIKECSDVGSVIMTLIGSSTENVYRGESYKEPGVILKTDKGQYLDVNDIKIKIVQYKDNKQTKVIAENRDYIDLINNPDGLIDTSDNYKYEITYTYNGPEGKAGPKTRIVEVKNKNNLACLILPTGTKNENGWIVDNRLAKIISINTDKSVKYSISETNKKDYSNGQYLLVSKDGEVTINGAVIDENGNESFCTGTIKYESGTPSCNIELSGTKLSTGWYTSDVSATLVPKIIASDINTKGMNLINAIEYNGYSNMIVNSSGTVYGYIKDEAGKSNKCHEQVKIDKTTTIKVFISGTLEGTTTSYTPETSVASNVILTGVVNPSSTPSGYKYQWYKDNVAITGATSIRYIARESGEYKLVVTTGSGIVGTSNTINVKIDTARPTCNLEIKNEKNSNGWYTNDVKINMSSKDAVYYGTTNSTTVDYNSLESITLTSTGRAYCYVANASKTVTNSNSTTEIKIDKTPPIDIKLVGNYTAKDPYNTESLNLVATARDPESGISKYIFYQYDSTYNRETLLGQNTTGVYSANNLLGSTTSLGFKVKACNNAGLCEEATLIEVCNEDPSLTTNCVNGSRTKGQTCTGTGRRIYYTDSTGCEVTPPSGNGGGSGSGSSHHDPESIYIKDNGDGSFSTIRCNPSSGCYPAITSTAQGVQEWFGRVCAMPNLNITNC